MLRAFILLVVLPALLAGCGGNPPAAPPVETMPGEPEAALVWVRAAEGDGAALRERLAAWPLEDEAFTFTAETQVVLTWRIRTALEDGEIQKAGQARDRLVRDYEGEGESPEGATLDARTLALGLFEAALHAARGAMDGARPDEARARRLLEFAETLLLPAETTDRRRLERTRAWLGTKDASGLPGFAGEAARPEAGAWVIVYADDYVLGDVRFTDVLARWQREGAHVDLVPVLRGQVRVGLRLVPAESRAAELAALRASAARAGLRIAQGGNFRSDGLPGEDLENLGFGPQEVLVIVVGPKGRIVGRLAGINPDLPTLDPVVQRLVSR